MSTIDALIADLTDVMGKHPHLTAEEWMQAVNTVAAGYWPGTELFPLADGAQMLDDIIAGLRARPLPGSDAA